MLQKILFSFLDGVYGQIYAIIVVPRPAPLGQMWGAYPKKRLSV